MLSNILTPQNIAIALHKNQIAIASSIPKISRSPLPKNQTAIATQSLN
ncbi:MAG: hypothetical protein ACK5EU_08510 [Pseudanabaena sp.]|nr:hypothetical protein [Pseudanabaena sp. M53BS1SP1A06MG]MCA6581676.1 hypothetical protein [Pseudanabaena sp. M34BS1SP1A06MG]MCA6593166.1 hypothetical protein [Pseudanabaena sp. M38BS1SP1A06MG]MCA6598464.1 hypothetical protein [Pseudanabaena sp. M046S1SP1A06QC]MCA6600128.1 hypothetical protein [Pseudanabaena sp. M57BS1SP1A06MG]MCA6605028.1 hypothetical protein [Pseudanabaena sp. M007S1SP1A06QC]MCA6613845.1 hypothetical protein [Pseudanabaena sp. M090S1SP1A06QC]MCA6624432.1 hypothetical prot